MKIDEIETLIYNYTPNYDTGFDKIRFFLNIDPVQKNKFRRFKF